VKKIDTKIGPVEVRKMFSKTIALIMKRPEMWKNRMQKLDMFPLSCYSRSLRM
jgi:hypothetical protein